MKEKARMKSDNRLLSLLKENFQLIIVAAACICILTSMKTVKAADYQSVNTAPTSVENRTVDGTVFYYDNGALKAIKNGQTITLLSSEKGKADAEIITNGKTVFAVYYFSGKSNPYNSKSKGILYRIQLSSRKKTKLCTIKSTSGQGVSMCAYYKGKLYYTKDLDPGSFWSYNLSSKKKKKIANNVTGVTQIGKYFILIPYDGDWGPGVLQAYDASKNKLRRVSGSFLSYYIGKTRIYYLEADSNKWNSEGYVARVKSCRLDGSGKKTLTKKFKLTGISELTEQYIKYKAPNKSTYSIIKY